MGKRLDITPKIAAAIARSTDNSVDPATVAVFQTSAYNTLPVSKKGTLFDQSRVTETTLRQMADYLNVGTQYAPLHLVHDQSEGELPVGRVFAGEVTTNEHGVAELQNLFYIPLATGADLIAKLDTAVIDEVSVGLRPQHINCSECGFDYLGADATWENIYMRQCNNEHYIGENGTHAILNGMDKYMELSLVSRGAAQKTKILSREKSLMASLGAENYQQLAASGKPPVATTLFASPTNPKKESHMDLTELVAKLTTAQADVTVKGKELETATANIATLTAANATLTGEVTALKADANIVKVNELTAKLTSQETIATAAIAFVREEANRLSIAASLTPPADTADLDALKASITAARTKLQETLPVGGAALSANTQNGSSKVVSSNAAFKTR